VSRSLFKKYKKIPISFSLLQNVSISLLNKNLSALQDPNALITQNEQSRRLRPRITQPMVQYFHRAPRSSSGDRKLLVSAACFLTARAAALLIFTSPIKHRKAFPKRRKGFSRERYLYGKKTMRAFFFPFSRPALSAAATREQCSGDENTA
jgi:hypothetical protein